MERILAVRSGVGYSFSGKKKKKEKKKRKKMQAPRNKRLPEQSSRFWREILMGGCSVAIGPPADYISVPELSQSKSSPDGTGNCVAVRGNAHGEKCK